MIESTLNPHGVHQTLHQEVIVPSRQSPRWGSNWKAVRDQSNCCVYICVNTALVCWFVHFCWYQFQFCNFGELGPSFSADHRTLKGHPYSCYWALLFRRKSSSMVQQLMTHIKIDIVLFYFAARFFFSMVSKYLSLYLFLRALTLVSSWRTEKMVTLFQMKTHFINVKLMPATFCLLVQNSATGSVGL